MKMLKDHEIDFSQISKERAERIKILLRMSDDPEGLLRSYKFLLKNKSEDEVKKILKEDIKFVHHEKTWKSK